MNLNFSLKDNKQFLLNILLTAGLGAIISFLNYLFNIYLARNITEYNFSLYTGAIGILYLIQIPSIAIQTVVTKKVAENRQVNLDSFKYQSLLHFTIVGIVLSLIFLFLRQPIADIANIPVEYMLPLSIALFSAIVSPITKGFLLGFEKIFIFNIVLLGETLLKFAMGVLAVNMSLDITIPILANTLPALLTMIIVLPLLKRESKILPSAAIRIDYRNLLLTFLTFFLINTPYTLDLVLVNPNNRAEYGALSLLGKVVYFASITIASLMLSKLANQKEEERKKTLYFSLIFTLSVGIVLSTLFYLFDTQVVEVVFKGMYTEISPFIGVYGLAMSIYAVSYMIVNYILLRDSFSHIFILILLTIFQIVLFRLNNETLQDAVYNQIAIYTLLSLYMVFKLIFKSSNNGRKEKHS